MNIPHPMYLESNPHHHPILIRNENGLQVSTNEYILDFRDPLSPLVAMATFCAVHAPKSLVATGP
jgi:hypothetical protein